MQFPLRVVLVVVTLAGVAAVATGRVATAQDSAFAPGTGPTVLIDLGHNSLLVNEPFLSPLTRLREDGYRARTFVGPFTESALVGVDVLVVVGAKADQNALRPPPECGAPAEMSPQCWDAINAEVARVWRHPIPSAFSADEVEVLHTWVRGGGGLLLVSDIFPMPGSIEALANRFGVEVSNGFAVDERLLPPLPQTEPPLLGRAGEIVFRRDDGTLASHPITNGRGPAERVNAVVSIAGSAFRLPTGGESLLTFDASSVSLLPEVAWEFSEATPRQPIGGWSQGGVLSVGAGRLAMFGESGILAQGTAFDERYPGMQNSQLVLNVVHWLSGVLGQAQ